MTFRDRSSDQVDGAMQGNLWSLKYASVYRNRKYHEGLRCITIADINIGIRKSDMGEMERLRINIPAVRRTSLFVDRGFVFSHESFVLFRQHIPSAVTALRRWIEDGGLLGSEAKRAFA